MGIAGVYHELFVVGDMFFFWSRQDVSKTLINVATQLLPIHRNFIRVFEEFIENGFTDNAMDALLFCKEHKCS